MLSSTYRLIPKMVLCWVAGYEVVPLPDWKKRKYYLILGLVEVLFQVIV